MDWWHDDTWWRLKIVKNGWIWYLKVFYIIWQSFRSVGRVLNVVLTVLMSCSKKFSSCSNFWKFHKMTLKLGQLIRNFAKWFRIPLDIIFNRFCTILSNLQNFLSFVITTSSCHQSMTTSPSVTRYYLYLTYQTILIRKVTILNVVLTVLTSCLKKFSSCFNFWKFPKITLKLDQLIWNFAKWYKIPLDVIFNSFWTILSNFKIFDFCHHDVIMSLIHDNLTLSH